MTLEEAKVVAVLRDRAEVGKIAAALDILYSEIRRLEIERELRLQREGA